MANAFDADTRMEEPADARRAPSPLNGEKVAEGRMRGGNAQDSDSRGDSNLVAEGALITRSFHVNFQKVRRLCSGAHSKTFGICLDFGF